MGGTPKYSEMLGILEAAIQREIAAAKLYADSLPLAEEPETKALLKRLVEAETEHRDLLQAEYQRLAARALAENEE